MSSGDRIPLTPAMEEEEQKAQPPQANYNSPPSSHGSQAEGRLVHWFPPLSSFVSCIRVNIESKATTKRT